MTQLIEHEMNEPICQFCMKSMTKVEDNDNKRIKFSCGKCGDMLVYDMPRVIRNKGNRDERFLFSKYNYRRGRNKGIVLKIETWKDMTDHPDSEKRTE